MSRKKPKYGALGGAVYIYKKGVHPPLRKPTVPGGVILSAMSKNKKYS